MVPKKDFLETLYALSDSLSLRLRVTLTLPDITTRRFIMQKAVRHPDKS